MPPRLATCAVFPRKRAEKSLVDSLDNHVYVKSVCREVTRGPGQRAGPSGWAGARRVEGQVTAVGWAATGGHSQTAGPVLLRHAPAVRP